MAKTKKSIVKKAKTASLKTKKTVKKTAFQKLFEKKPHIEFIVALLSVPFFLSVIFINFNTIRDLNKESLSPTPEIETDGHANGKPGKFYAAPIIETKEPEAEVTQTNSEPCIESLGPVSISTPEEKEVVTDNPVNVLISYDDSTYCGAAWSYRINGGKWSGYDDRSVALYNLPQGKIVFELRVRSIVNSNDQKTLTRTFTYAGGSSNPPSASESGQ